MNVTRRERTEGSRPRHAVRRAVDVMMQEANGGDE
jgi:hypothetical protein